MVEQVRLERSFGESLLRTEGGANVSSLCLGVCC